jgi:hypothetical protein
MSKVIKLKVIEQDGVRTGILVDLDTILHLLRIDESQYSSKRFIYDYQLRPPDAVSRMTKEDVKEKLKLFGYTEEDAEKILEELEKLRMIRLASK